MKHKPVMLQEMLHYIQPKDNEIYIDATFGAGGYSRALLSSAQCTVYGLDRDPHVQPIANGLEKEFPEKFKFILGDFAEINNLLSSLGIQKVNAVIFDIGVSSMQLDQAERGFSFMQDGPLDMRMCCQGETAADFINNASEEALANILYKYGGERKSRRIAKYIVEDRKNAPITTTKQLVDIIKRVVKAKPHAIHPATRSFQAIRIYLNNELQQLADALIASEKLLAPGGKLLVVTFHSLEDKIVKAFFNTKSGKNIKTNRHIPQLDEEQKQSTLALLTKKAVKPSGEEVKKNHRARSAKLRAAYKVTGENV